MNETDIIETDPDLARIAEKDAESKMLKQIVDADKAIKEIEKRVHVAEPARRGIRGEAIGLGPIRGRNVGPVRKSRGIPVIYRESAQQSNDPGVTIMDRILVLPRRGRVEPKNDPIAQEKAIAKRNRKGRKLEDAVASGGWK